MRGDPGLPGIKEKKVHMLMAYFKHIWNGEPRLHEAFLTQKYIVKNNQKYQRKLYECPKPCTNTGRTEFVYRALMHWNNFGNKFRVI